MPLHIKIETSTFTVTNPLNPITPDGLIKQQTPDYRNSHTDQCNT